MALFKMDLCSLPADVLGLIFQNFDDGTQVDNAAQSCRALLNIGRSPTVWKYYCQKLSPGAPIEPLDSWRRSYIAAYLARNKTERAIFASRKWLCWQAHSKPIVFLQHLKADQIVSCDAAGAICLWRISGSQHELVQQLQIQKEVESSAFCQRSCLCAFYGAGRLVVCSVADSRLQLIKSIEFSSEVTCLATITQNAQDYLLVGSEKSNFEIRHLPDLALVSYQSPESLLEALPSGTVQIFVSMAQDVIWELRTKSTLIKWTVSPSFVLKHRVFTLKRQFPSLSRVREHVRDLDVAVDPNGEWCFLVGCEGILEVYRQPTSSGFYAALFNLKKTIDNEGGEDGEDDVDDSVAEKEAVADAEPRLVTSASQLWKGHSITGQYDVTPFNYFITKVSSRDKIERVKVSQIRYLPMSRLIFTAGENELSAWYLPPGHTLKQAKKDNFFNLPKCALIVEKIHPFEDKISKMAVSDAGLSILAGSESGLLCLINQNADLPNPFSALAEAHAQHKQRLLNDALVTKHAAEAELLRDRFGKNVVDVLIRTYEEAQLKSILSRMFPKQPDPYIQRVPAELLKHHSAGEKDVELNIVPANVDTNPPWGRARYDYLRNSADAMMIFLSHHELSELQTELHAIEALRNKSMAPPMFILVIVLDASVDPEQLTFRGGKLEFVASDAIAATSKGASHPLIAKVAEQVLSIRSDPSRLKFKL